jgi:hypothetical protein
MWKLLSDRLELVVVIKSTCTGIWVLPLLVMFEQKFLDLLTGSLSSAWILTAAFGEKSGMIMFSKTL